VTKDIYLFKSLISYILTHIYKCIR